VSATATAAAPPAATAAPSVAAAPPKVTPHRLGVLFEILDEMGENPRFLFALSKLGVAEPLAQAEIHHRESDGYGGLTRFLRDQGVRFEAPTFRGDTRPPPLLERVRAVLRVARDRGGEPLAFLRTNPAWTRGAPVTARAGAGRLLAADASARVFAAAKAEGVSVTSFLLHRLTESVGPLVIAPGTSVAWGVPVNMRGPVRIEPDDANASSIMPVRVPRGATPAAVQEALSGALAANLHWGKWDQLNLVARLGKRALRKKVSHFYRTADAARLGIFSNVGSWRGQSADDVGVIAYGLPTLTDPIFAAALTWNGMLALTLRAHPSLTGDDAEVGRWLDAWITALGAGA
jgi:hypothetical protein